ncbi:hypothetical protein [Polaromonas sp. UC242_47]|uniref:hypothetical protein n=1 Tax=Polaromonas sp. UC242_47 TaxID=3374626 RepID=UPI0037CC6A54
MKAGDRLRHWPLIIEQAEWMTLKRMNRCQEEANQEASTIYHTSRKWKIDEIRRCHGALLATPKSFGRRNENISRKAKRPHEVGVLGTRSGDLEVGCAGKI